MVTLWRWSKQPAFQEALRQARREAFSQSMGRLQQASVVVPPPRNETSAGMSRWRVLARDVLHEAGAVPVQIEGAVLQASQGRFAENLAAPDFDKFETTVAGGGAIPLAKGWSRAR